MRPSVALPMFDGRLVAFTSARDGLLATPAKALQEAPHVVPVITNAEVPFGDCRDTPTGPHLAGVAAFRRAGQQDACKLFTLLGLEAYWTTGDRLGLQSIFAPLLKRCLPGIDRATGTADLTGNPQRAVAGFQQLKGTKTTVLQLRWTTHWS